MVVDGISTRKAQAIIEEFCGKKFSKSTVSALCQKLDPLVHTFQTRPLKTHYSFIMVDAIYLKMRKDSRVKSRGLLITICVNKEGHREIIGFHVANSESESSWGKSFSFLKERELKNVHLITSDEHNGLVKAAKKHFHSFRINRQ